MVRALSSAEEGRHLQASQRVCSTRVGMQAVEARPRFLANVEHFGNEPGLLAWRISSSSTPSSSALLLRSAPS